MKKNIIGLVGVFLVNNIIGILVAKFILTPLLNEKFGSTLRPIEGLEFPSLTGGYFVLSLLMIFGYQFFKFSTNWKTNGIVFGILCGGLTFLSDHMITAGWSILPPTPMFISGIIDILVTITGGLFISYIYRHETQS